MCGTTDGAGVPFSPAPSGTGGAGGTDERAPLASHQRSLTPMTPKRPPKGMVLPNAFGLLSMQSFKKAGLSGDDSARCVSTIEEVCWVECFFTHSSRGLQCGKRVV